LVNVISDHLQQVFEIQILIHFLQAMKIDEPEAKKEEVTKKKEPIVVVEIKVRFLFGLISSLVSF
jgi:hypothetical protein